MKHRRTALRVLLIATTVLSVLVCAIELLEIAITGNTDVRPSRLIRMEVNTAVVSVLTTWWIGWKMVRD